MKKYIFTVASILAFPSITYSEVKTINKDFSDNIAKLPERVDNSKLKYMPPVIRQAGNECAFITSTYTMFSYEMNRLLNRSGRSKKYQYPYQYTHNYFNRGQDDAGYAHLAWKLIKELGVPDAQSYGGINPHAMTYWMSGYDIYYKAMKNRLEGHAGFKPGSPESINRLKSWLYNAHGTHKHGGVAFFQSQFTGHTMVKYRKGGYKKLITSWGNKMLHAMTIVGYDDNVGYDVNGDKKITNDKDINGDGKVDMRDWEKGAFIILNSHGKEFADKGKAYMLYRLCAQKVKDGGIQEYDCAIIDVIPEYQPRLTLKIKLKHSNRSALKIRVGLANDQNSEEPLHSKVPFFFSGGKCLGELPMNGKSKSPLEMGVDLTDIWEKVDKNKTLKFFIEYSTREGISSKGEIESISLLQYDSKGTQVKNLPIKVVDGDITATKKSVSSKINLK